MNWVCFSRLYRKKTLLKNRDVKGVKSLGNFLQQPFFVAANGSKISESAVIWKSKSPRCFKNIRDKTRPSMIHYLSNETLQNNFKNIKLIFLPKFTTSRLQLLDADIIRAFDVSTGKSY